MAIIHTHITVDKRGYVYGPLTDRLTMVPQRMKPLVCRECLTTVKKLRLNRQSKLVCLNCL